MIVYFFLFILYKNINSSGEFPILVHAYELLSVILIYIYILNIYIYNIYINNWSTKYICAFSSAS